MDGTTGLKILEESVTNKYNPITFTIMIVFLIVAIVALIWFLGHAFEEFYKTSFLRCVSILGLILICCTTIVAICYNTRTSYRKFKARQIGVEYSIDYDKYVIIDNGNFEKEIIIFRDREPME